jgi:hypothetical protein
MKNDPIVEEVRKHRLQHAASYNYDLAEICRALKEAEEKSCRPVVTRSPRLLLRKSGT